MALIGNRSVLHKSPGRFLNGGHGILRHAFTQHGMARGSLAAMSPLAAVPSGYTSPVARVLPKTAGDMSARFSADISFDAAASGTMGLPTTGSAALAITASDAYGELIAFGTGTALASVAANSPALTASIGAAGSAIFTVSGAGAIGAEASGSGDAVFYMLASATILPLDDAPPQRTGAAGMSFTGALTPYAVGSMTGTTEDTGLTPAGIANSVWGKVIEAGFSADQILRILAAQAAGTATGLEGANPQFIGLDGTTVRIDGGYAAGTRTIDALNGD